MKYDLHKTLGGGLKLRYGDDPLDYYEYYELFNYCSIPRHLHPILKLLGYDIQG